MGQRRDAQGGPSPGRNLHDAATSRRRRGRVLPTGVLSPAVVGRGMAVVGWAVPDAAENDMARSAHLECHEPRSPQGAALYLQTLAVHPSRQRQGVGSFLISPTLECADRDRLPVYLETTKEANVTYYRRFGFDVVEDLMVGGALRVWTMLRRPRT